MQSKNQDDGVQLSSRYLQYCFAKRHLGGIPRREVFPLGGANKKDIIQINQPKHSSDRIYREDGLSPTINTMQGGNRQPFISKIGLYAIPVLTPNRVKKRQNGRRFKEDGEPSFTVTTQDQHGVYDGKRIRRLTPTECEKLQGFPPGWTKYGIDNNSHIEYNGDGNNNLLCKQSTIQKLNKAKNVRWRIVKEGKKPISVTALCTISDGRETESLSCKRKAIDRIKGVRIAIEKLENTGQWKCVVDITKCGGITEKHSTWKIKEVVPAQGDILGQQTEKACIELSWKNISEDNSTQTKYHIISIVAKQIIESLICTFARGRSMHISINNLTILSQKELKVGVLSLKTENIVLMSDSARYKQCGNAVTVNVIEALFKKLI